MSLTQRQQRGQKSYAQGHAAEWVALLWLLLKGYRPVASRVSSRRGTGAGELDLIVRRGRVLVFVEVKKRQDKAGALTAVSPRQQQRILRGAQRFLQNRPDYAGFTCRFDVVAIVPWRLPMHIADAWRSW